MSHYTLFVISGISIIKGTLFGIHYYKDIQKEIKMDKEYIKELEEEIIRLKREMKICGVYSNKNDIEIFNKKAIYIYIREMIDVDTFQITKVIKILNNKFDILLNDRKYLKRDLSIKISNLIHIKNIKTWKYILYIIYIDPLFFPSSIKKNFFINK